MNGAVTDGTSGGILPNIVLQVTDGANAGKSATTDATGTYAITDKLEGRAFGSSRDVQALAAQNER